MVLLVGAAATSAPAREAAYPQLPKGPWHFEPKSYVGGFTVKAPTGKPTTLTKISYVTGTERAGCPAAGTAVKVLGSVKAKPAKKLEGVYGNDPWIAAKAYQPTNAAYTDYYGLKPVSVKIDVGGTTVAGHFAAEFSRHEGNGKYIGHVNVIEFGGCFLYPAFSYPGKS
jgi:hypothetical protein